MDQSQPQQEKTASSTQSVSGEDAALVISTYPDKDSLMKTASSVVKEQLAACVNVTSISSVYMWQGNIEEGPEYWAFFKTSKRKRESLKDKIKRTHPYEVPEILEVKVDSINKPYMDWLQECTA